MQYKRERTKVNLSCKKKIRHISTSQCAPALAYCSRSLMLFNHVLVALAVSNSLVLAGPAWHTSSGMSLVQELDRRAGLSGLAQYNLSNGAEILNSSNAEFASETVRWSAFAAPTFDIAFVPAEENDISIAVSSGTPTPCRPGVMWKTADVCFLRTRPAQVYGQP